MLCYTFSTSPETKLLNIMELEVVTIHGPSHQYESIPYFTQNAIEAQPRTVLLCLSDNHCTFSQERTNKYGLHSDISAFQPFQFDSWH
ncbi:uncharacterized protein ARMOST_11436 [Armillaria ostoyae]|uniref:Uncharacterized protein n=1 Tax=Armillaria ostoyae TaxID=47428 RepID=A0A284RH47_ARMOS|nr:uncharacterized protein ARMOST_11436 [Armillaria ostoyae]